MPRAVFATLALLALSTLCTAQQASQSNATQSLATKSSPPTLKEISTQPFPASQEDSAAEQELLALANQRRHEAGAPPLRMDVSLSNAARAHARLMVNRQQLSHQFDGEPSLMPRLLETGLRLDRVGENVAFNATAEKAFEALMQSPPHRRNLLDPSYNSAGFAAFWSNGRIYVVQDFAHRLPSVTQTSLP